MNSFTLLLTSFIATLVTTVNGGWIRLCKRAVPITPVPAPIPMIPEASMNVQERLKRSSITEPSPWSHLRSKRETILESLPAEVLP